MNNAKMWLVVSPTVGVPIFLGAVAVGSFAVHLAVLSNTTWVADFMSGRELGSSAQTAAMEVKGTETATANLAAAPVALGGETVGRTVTVVMPDGSLATAVLNRPVELAADNRASRLPSD